MGHRSYLNQALEYMAVIDIRATRKRIKKQ